MSDFAEIIECDKVGQQPLVQSVLKGSKKLKPRGSKRRRLWSLSYSTSIFMGSQLIKTPVVYSDLFLTSSCMLQNSVNWRLLGVRWQVQNTSPWACSAFRCTSLVPGDSFFAEAALARQEPWFSSDRRGVSSPTGWLGTECRVIPAVRCCVAWGKSLKLSVSSSVK